MWIRPFIHDDEIDRAVKKPVNKMGLKIELSTKNIVLQSSKVINKLYKTF